MITAVRTPDDCFSKLPEFDFTPRYIEPSDNGLRMHYLDEGAGNNVYLCLHGQPSWCYLYRKMIPIFASRGRVVAPDLFGFGRSDKPVDDGVHTFDFHRNSLIALIEALDLRKITLVCQDWGGLLGLTIPMAMPERFARLIVMNTTLATGDTTPGPGFAAWRAFNQSNPDLDVGGLMKMATPILSDAQAAAYSAPFPDKTFKAGVRRLPDMVPTSPDQPGAALSRQAAGWWSTDWNGPSFMAIGAQDKVIVPDLMHSLRANIRGCPEPKVIADAGHFVQEWGEGIATEAVAYFDSL